MLKHVIMRECTTHVTLLTQILHNSQHNSALNQIYSEPSVYFLFAFFHSVYGGIGLSVFATV